MSEIIMSIDPASPDGDKCCEILAKVEDDGTIIIIRERWKNTEEDL